MNTRWVGNDETELAVVMSQSPSPGSLLGPDAEVELEVSAGGPTILWPRLPASLRDLTRELPEYDITEPVLVIDTPAGPAYKVDRFLFGSCDAVDQASGSVMDTRYEDLCVQGSATVSGVLLDGTTFEVSGLPPGDYPPEGLGGIVIVDRPEGTSMVLGIVGYARVGDEAEPSVDLFDGRLVAAAGQWAMWVDIYPHVLEALSSQEVDRLPELIRPNAMGDHLVVELAPPLRFHEPGEVPAEMVVYYPGFQVVLGCSEIPKLVIYCEPNNNLSVLVTDEWLKHFPLEVHQR